MNIFFLDRDVTACAQAHNDKHCVKMILEYSQLLSSAHRFHDGKKVVAETNICKKKTFYLLEGEHVVVQFDPIIRLDTLQSRKPFLTIDKPKCYGHTHIHHPSTVWTRDNNQNYAYLYSLLLALHEEYTYRYERVHKSTDLLEFLKEPPAAIPIGQYFDPTPAMPDQYKTGDSIESYRRYYRDGKSHLATWKKRSVPAWYLKK